MTVRSIVRSVPRGVVRSVPHGDGEGAGTLSFTGELDDPTEQVAYEDSVAITGGDGVYSITAQSGLPDGITASIDGTDLVFSGTATESTAGLYDSISVTVEDSLGVTGIFLGEFDVLPPAGPEEFTLDDGTTVLTLDDGVTAITLDA